VATDQDYYDVMGVPRTASQDDIKKAYRELVKKYHPDLHKDDTSAPKHMSEVNEAYDALSDPAKRRQYDVYGKAGPTGFPGAGQAWAPQGRGSGETSGNYAYGDSREAFRDAFRDAYDSFVGGSGRQQTEEARRGRDLGARMTLTLEEAVFGAKKEVNVRRNDACDTCHGSGAAPGTSPRVCPTCGGRGEVRVTQTWLLGRIESVDVCPTCKGEGQLFDVLCPACKGNGVTRRDRIIEVTIPPGVDTGTKVRVAGQGDAGRRGGQAGDLNLYVTVEADSRYQRQGSTLYFRAKLTPSKAVLGTAVSVPLVEGGTETVSIPAGSQHGSEVRIRGKGAQSVGDRRRGDLVVQVEVVIPKTLGAEQRKLYKQLMELDK
jgi:molecular chaperone DnaJ